MWGLRAPQKGNMKEKIITIKVNGASQGQWSNLLLELNLIRKAWKAYGVDISLKAPGIRSVIDLRNEKINYKVREHSVNKVPFILVLGDREVKENTITIRRLGSKDQKTIKVDEFIDLIKNESLPPDIK